MDTNLSNKHRRTLTAIFDTPVRANIAWTDCESLLLALGAKVKEGNGSRVRVALNGVRAVFHEPHPHKEICKCTVKDIRDFLGQAEVVQEDDTG